MTWGPSELVLTPILLDTPTSSRAVAASVSMQATPNPKNQPRTPKYTTMRPKSMPQPSTSTSKPGSVAEPTAPNPRVFGSRPTAQLPKGVPNSHREPNLAYPSAPRTHARIVPLFIRADKTSLHCVKFVYSIKVPCKPSVKSCQWTSDRSRPDLRKVHSKV
jgi:hypothetical protein